MRSVRVQMKFFTFLLFFVGGGDVVSALNMCIFLYVLDCIIIVM